MDARASSLPEWDAVTALGGVKTLWESLKAGKSGIRRIETINVEHVPGQDRR